MLFSEVNIPAVRIHARYVVWWTVKRKSLTPPNNVDVVNGLRCLHPLMTAVATTATATATETTRTTRTTT